MKENLFELVRQITKAEAKVSVDVHQSTEFEFNLCEKLAVEQGPIEKHFIVNAYFRVVNEKQVIYCNENYCNEGGTLYINGLEVSESKFTENLINIGLENYTHIFNTQDSDWDGDESIEKILRSSLYVKETFLDKGFRFYGTLSPEEKINVQSGRHWSDYEEKSEA